MNLTVTHKMHGFIKAMIFTSLALVIILMAGCRAKTKEEDVINEPIMEFSEELVVDSCECVEIESEDPESNIVESYWPPPKASARAKVDYMIFNSKKIVQTISDAKSVLCELLIEAGYSDLYFYPLNDGFMIITRMERIHPDGSPDPNLRWELGSQPMRSFSIAEFLSRLFSANRGQYRVFAFIVTAQAFRYAEESTSLETIEDLYTLGYDTLPPSIANLPYTKQHETTALIYEFVKPEVGEARFIAQSTITAQEHLRKSNL